MRERGLQSLLVSNCNLGAEGLGNPTACPEVFYFPRTLSRNGPSDARHVDPRVEGQRDDALFIDYFLFIDDTLPLPRWLEVHSLDDLKGNLISLVIAVLAVLFLREAITWDGSRDLLAFSIPIALIIAVLTFYLKK